MPTTTDDRCYFEGQLRPLSEARVGVMTHAFNYGTCCFEGIRAYWNADEQALNVFRLREHMQRLERSMRTLLIDLNLSVDDLCRLALDVLAANDFSTDVYLRPLAYKATEVIGVRLHDLRDALTIYAVPLGDYIATGGLHVGVSSWRRIDDNAAPARAKLTGIYVNSALAKTEAHLNGYDEAIMLTDDGHVSEGSAENLFMLVGEQLITPPPSDNILLGITRDTIITLARAELGLTVVERSIDRSELYGADELLLCGTGAQIAPVLSVDRRPVGAGEIGPRSARLQQLYDDIVRGRDARYQHWLTPVAACPTT
jgi:branched-chain amino acid aminotransferase